MDRAGSRPALGGDGIDATYLLFWNLLGGANLSLEHGLAKSDDRSPSAYRAARRSDWQTHACDPPGCSDAKAINSELLSRLQDPFLKISLGIRIVVFLGIVLLMGAKPDLWESISIVGTSVVLGLLSSLLAWRRDGSLSAPSADLGD